MHDPSQAAARVRLIGQRDPAEVWEVRKSLDRGAGLDGVELVEPGAVGGRAGNAGEGAMAMAFVHRHLERTA